MLRNPSPNPLEISPVKMDILFARFRKGEDELRLMEEFTHPNPYNQNSLHCMIYSKYSYQLPTCFLFIGYLATGKQGDKSAVVNQAYALLSQRMSYQRSPDEHIDRPIDLIKADDQANIQAYLEMMISLVSNGLDRQRAQELLMTKQGSLLPQMLEQAKKLYAYDMLAFLDSGFLNQKELGGFNGFAKRRKAAEIEIREHEKNLVSFQPVRESQVDEDGFVLVDSGLQQFNLHAQPARLDDVQARYEREYEPVVIKF